MKTPYGTLNPSQKSALFDDQRLAVERMQRLLTAFAEVELSKNEPNKIHQNVISLLGNRGTGKTTTLMQLQKVLTQNVSFKKWIIGDLFLPDLLHTNTAIVPAGMYFISDMILKRAEEDNSEHKEDISKRFVSLTMGMGWLTNESPPTDMMMRDSIGHEDFSEKLFKYYRHTTEAPAQFRRWVDESLEALSVDYLIFFVDDSDISSGMVEQILEFTRYYLSCDRVITILAADETTLRRRLFNNRIEDIKSLAILPEGSGLSFLGGNSDSFKSRELDAEADYVDAFLTKVMPPSTRVYLKDVDHTSLLNHKFHLGKNETCSVLDLLSEIELRCGEITTNLGALVAKYPGVLASNLRAFVNQFNLLYEVLGRSDRSTDITKRFTKETAQVGASEGISLSFSNSPIELRRLLEILRVFFHSPIHRKWIEQLSQYDIVDVMSENDLKYLLTEISSRTNFIGTRTKTNMYNVSGVQLSHPEETNLFDLIIDICVAGGTSYKTMARAVSNNYESLIIGETLGTEIKPVVENKLNHLSRALVVKTASTRLGVGGVLNINTSLDRLTPFFIGHADENGWFYNLGHSQINMERANERNHEYVTEILAKENQVKSILQGIESRQLYSILHDLLKQSCLLFAGATSVMCQVPQLSYNLILRFSSSLTQEWGVYRFTKVWTTLSIIANAAWDSSLNECDENECGLRLFMYLSELPYEIIFSAVTDANAQAELDARACVLSSLLKLKNSLKEKKLITDTDLHEDFSKNLNALEGFPQLKSDMRQWPGTIWRHKFKSLLHLIDYIEKHPNDLKFATDLSVEPPPYWKKWVDSVLSSRKYPAKTSSKRK